jgi:hypothetical protein
VISDFTPKVGKAGTIVTITGANFDPDPARNAVSVGGVPAPVLSASPTTLVCSVGAGASTGKVVVSTGPSIEQSSADFIQLPGTLLVQDVGFVGRVDPGTPTVVALSTAGKKGLLSFDGSQGQWVSLYVTGVTFSYSSVKVYEPSGSCIFTAAVSAGTDWTLPLPALPRTGTYTVVFEPSLTSTGAATVRVYTDVALSIDARSGPVTMTLPRGQNGRLTFAARPGDQLDLTTSTVTTPAGANVNLALLQPDGASIGSFSAPGSGPWQLPKIAMPGLHVVTVRPLPTYDATLTFVLSLPLGGKLVVGGAPTRFQTTRAGQTGRYTFEAAAGESDTLKVTCSFASTLSIAVIRPNGSVLATASASSSSAAKLDLGALPESGIYTVTVVPSGQATGSADLSLLAQDLGTLSCGDPPKAITLLAGQNGRYTFAGQAGSYVSFGFTANSTTPSGGYTTFGLLRPDGVLMASTSVSSPTSWQPPVLPSAGTYTLTVSPPNLSAGSTTVLLSAPITGSLAADGGPVRFESSRAGQQGRYTFQAAAGASYTLKAVASTGFTGSVPVTVYRPNGAYLGSRSISSGAGSKLDLSLLPDTGAYTVTVVPPGVGTGYVDLTLFTQDSGTISIDGDQKAVSLLSGQSGRYTFAATAGDLVQLSYLSLVTTPPGSTVQLSIYKPDRSVLANKAVSAPGTWAIPQIPVTGSYTLFVEPAETTAATLVVALPRR